MVILDSSAAERDAAPKRRFRFSLRMLMLAVALVGGWLGWNVWQLRTREALRREIGWRGAVVRSADPRSPNTLPTMWRLMGADRYRAIELPSDAFTEKDLEHVKRWFPEADVVLYGRPSGMM